MKDIYRLFFPPSFLIMLQCNNLELLYMLQCHHKLEVLNMNITKDKIKKRKLKYKYEHDLLYLESDIVNCVQFVCLVVVMYLHLSESERETFTSKMVPCVSALSEEVCFTIFTWCASG